MIMKTMTVVGLLAGVAVIGGAVMAADGYLGWFGESKPAPVLRPMAQAQAPATPAASPMAAMGNALDIQPNDRVQGSMTAPLTMIEYASMTCSHCADFNNDTMPQVKKDWIATGKMKYVLRDLAWDNLAVGMAKVARCAPPSQFSAIADAFFKNQSLIVTGNDPLAKIKEIAATFGMDGAKVDTCIKDAALHTEVENSKKIAMEGLGVRGTPAIFVNGTKVDGAVDYPTLKKTLEEAYAKATAKR